MENKELLKAPQIKLVVDDLEVEFNVGFADDFISDKSKNSTIEKEIGKNISDINKRLQINDNKIAKLNEEIDRLTNHADKVDYAVAVSSGIIAGFIDIFVIGEWNFKKAKAISNKEINEKVLRFAEKQGYTGKRLDGAIEFLEKKFPLPGDNTWKTTQKGITAKSHHLDDFSHHPTLIGLIFSIISQFTKTAIYSNSKGELITTPFSVDENGYIEGKTPAAKIGAGIINWCFNVARNWRGHLFSDMAGSKHTAGGGMGIPGPILSTLKELSSLPGFRDTNFPKKLAKAFEKGIGNSKGQLDLGILNYLFVGASSKMDLRTENAFFHELKRQSLPVIINEIVVRAFYFIRRLIKELKLKKDIDLIDWKKVLPYNNRTIARMLTIATGTFTLIDLADAAIRGVVKSSGNGVKFAKEFILRVNFVGVGRFVIALGNDVIMGIRKEKRRNERIALMIEQLHLMNAKIFYFQANMWKAAENTLKSIEEVKALIEKTYLIAYEIWKQNEKSFENIGEYIKEAKKYNPNLDNDILEILN